MKKNINLISLGLLGESDLMYDETTKTFRKASGDDYGKIVGRIEHKADTRKPSKVVQLKNRIKKRNINVDELVSEVNKFDKEFDVKPRHLIKWRNPKEYLKVLINKSDFVLTSIIGIINGVNISSYTKAALDNESFTDLSNLDWDSDNAYKDSSIVFRCRYLTLVLTKFLGNTKKIASKINRKKYKRNESENEANIFLISKMMNHVMIFVNALLGNREYKNVIIKINEYISYLDKEADQKDVKNTTANIIMNIREGFKVDRLTKSRFYDDDMAIDDILKLSYVLATNDACFNRLPKFKHIKGASTKYDLSGLIQAVGKEVLRYDGYYNPMFQAYLEAHSKVISDFYNEASEDEALLMGIYALAFARFVLHMKSTDKFINEMLKQGV